MDNFFNLVDVALDQLKAHGFHQKKLDIELVDLAVSGNAIELQATIILFNFKEKL